MKSFVAILTMLLSTVTSAEEEVSHLRVYSKHHVEEHVVNQEALDKKQDMFYRMAHMESTPWDSKPDERATKCEDLCMLNKFWKFSRHATACIAQRAFAPFTRRGLRPWR